MKNLNLRLVLFSLAILVLSANEASACSCLGRSTVLDEFERSQLVIVAKAVAVEKTEEAKDVDLNAEIGKAGYDTTYRLVKSTKMKVEKVYKGDVKVGDELLFGQGGGADCIWTFGVKAVGKSFLFYLNNPSTRDPFDSELELSKTPMYYPVTCGRSQSIGDYETDDLKFLNNLSKVKGKTRISGQVTSWANPAPDVSNIPISIVGKEKTYKTQTDQNGVYEIYDLPAGSYLLKPQIPKGWKLNERLMLYSPAFSRYSVLSYGEDDDFSAGVPLQLEAGRHNGVDFFLEPDTAIQGRVLSPVGKPMKDVCVTAVLKSQLEGDYRGRFDCTNELGEFVISDLYPNKYILVANSDGKISASAPFERLFYGDTFNYSEAKSVEARLGERLSNLIIKVPVMKEMITISGRLVFANGKPVPKGEVRFDTIKKFENVDGEVSVETDIQGYFRFQVLKGYYGGIIGARYVTQSDFVGCPRELGKVKRMLSGKTSGLLMTDPKSVDTEEDVSGLILRLDFSVCSSPKTR